MAVEHGVPVNFAALFDDNGEALRVIFAALGRNTYDVWGGRRFDGIEQLHQHIEGIPDFFGHPNPYIGRFANGVWQQMMRQNLGQAHYAFYMTVEPLEDGTYGARLCIYASMDREDGQGFDEELEVERFVIADAEALNIGLNWCPYSVSLDGRGGRMVKWERR